MKPERGDRPDVNNLVILSSDGASSRPRLAYEEYLLFNFSNTEIAVIAIGDESMLNLTELELFAGDPVNNLFRADSFGDLDRLKDRVVGLACKCGGGV